LHGLIHTGDLDKYHGDSQISDTLRACRGILSLVYLEILPFNPVWMGLLIGLAVFLCHTLNRPEYSVPAALTVAVILFFSYLNPELSPLMNVVFRFFEIIIGSAIAILIIRLLPYVRDQTV